MLRVVLSVALLCMSVSGATTGNSKRQMIKEIVPGIGSYYFHPDPMNWTDAASYCRTDRNEILAFPNSPDEAALLSTMMKSYRVSYIHVGFHDQFREGEYYTLTGDRVLQSCYKNFYNVPGGYEKNCGALKDTWLMDIPCNTKYPFICVNYNFYKEDFEYIPGHGYYQMHRARRSWIDAQQTCEAEGARLLVLNSESELSALNSRYGQFTVWVGVHHKFVNWQFMTLFDETLASTGFRRFEKGQPSGTNDQYPYLVINSAPGFGLSLRRANDMYSFICEYRHGALRPPPT